MVLAEENKEQNRRSEKSVFEKGNQIAVSLFGTCGLSAVKDGILIKLADFFLLVFFALVAFDGYLGAVLSFPIVVAAFFVFALFQFKFAFVRNTERLPKIIVLYIVYSLIGIAIGGPTYNNLLFIQMTAFIFLFTARRYSANEIKPLLRLAPVLLAVFCVLNIMYAVEKQSGIYMGLKDIVDPNFLVTNTVLVLALALADLKRERNAAAKTVKICVIAAYFIVIALIGSRGGLLAAAAVVIVWLYTQTKNPLRLTLTLFAAGCLIIALSTLFLPDYILKRFTFENMIGGGGSGRLTIWKNYFKIYIEQDIFGLLFGVGRDVAPALYADKFGKVYYAHNIFVRALVEGGIVGFILLIGVLAFVAVKAVKGKNAALIAALAGFTVGAMFLDMDNMRVFWLILSAACMNVKKEMRILDTTEFVFEERGKAEGKTHYGQQDGFVRSDA